MTHYKAYIKDSNGFVANITPNNKGGLGTGNSADGPYLLVPHGSDVTISLKHNQKLVFVDLEVGASFTLKELASAGYIAGYELVLNGEEPPRSGANTEPNQDLAIPATPVNYIGEEQNYVAYTNTRNLTTPTGISVDNLPYVVLIGMALAGLMGFAAVKYRKRSDA